MAFSETGLLPSILTLLRTLSTFSLLTHTKMQALTQCAVAARVDAPARASAARRVTALSSRVHSKALKAGSL